LVLTNRPEFFKSFDLIIETNLKESTKKKLAQYLWNENIPMVILRSYGLIGYIRVISKEHTSRDLNNKMFFFGLILK
jgi:amyloid beta precursor protein binding protein 1